ELALASRERQLFDPEHPSFESRTNTNTAKSTAKSGTDAMPSTSSLESSLRETIELRETVERLLASAR
ncbi:hypothetical protein Pmar_PMAR019902, partial [Perkinsus marinus ATCC 50983]